MRFELLDISADLERQPFELGQYDLVIASHVLHATSNLERSLSNIHQLLKPEGQLLLMESTVPEAVDLGFAFGLLKDWWAPLETDERSLHSPCLPASQWDRILRETGFSGVDLHVQGEKDTPGWFASVITSTNVPSPSALPTVDYLYIVDESVQSQVALGQILTSSHLGNTRRSLALADLASLEPSDQTILVILLEVDAFFLDGIDKGNYSLLNNALQRFKNVLWVTRAASHKDPRHRLADGVGRTLMSEDSVFKFATLELGEIDRDLQQAAADISRLAQRMTRLPVERIENVVSVGGQYQISRVIENQAMDNVLTKATSKRYVQPCAASDMPLALHMRDPAQLDTLEWREESVSDVFSPLLEDEVVVELRAIGLTLRDFAIVKGKLDDYELGTEFAGLVTAANSSSGFRVGDPVFSVGPTRSKTIMKVKAQSLALIPSNMSFAEAASLPVALWLSYHGLLKAARLQRHETVLIDKAASSVGQIAIQIAQNIGATVLVAVRSSEEETFLQEAFHIPDIDTFNTNDEGWLTWFSRRTQGTGVDVIMTFPEENGNDPSLTACLAPFGRLCVAGFSLPRGDLPGGTGTNSHIPNAIYISISMIDMLETRPDMAYKIFHQAVTMAIDERLVPSKCLQIHGLSEIFEAFSSFERAGGTVPVKQVLAWNGGDVTTVRSTYFHTYEVSMLSWCNDLGKHEEQAQKHLPL